LETLPAQSRKLERKPWTVAPSIFHVPRHHFHGHVRKRLVPGLPGKNEIARLELFKLAQDCDRPRGHSQERRRR